MDNNIPKNFNIEVEIIPKYSTEEMKAAMKKSNWTTDDVICGIRKAVFTYQIKVDYEAFIESLQDLMTEYYGFIVTAVSESGQSPYDYSISAADKNNEICYIFRLNLRISENKESMFQSKGKCDELIKDISKDPRPYTKIITINNENYDSYEKAFVDIVEQIEESILGISNC